MMNIRKRLYDDFLRPSKEREYEEILKCACENGYEFHTVLSFEKVIEEGVKEGKKYLILRRDVDTADFKILRKLLALEKKYGAKATYYFRWNTLNVNLMNDIAEAGGEASYHYEEVASYCFNHRIKNKELMLACIEDIRELFIKNYFNFKKITSQPCLTVASHGDFVNKIIDEPSLILMNERVRSETGIVREAYDRERMDLLTCRIADQEALDFFTEKSISAIEGGEKVLELLTHPRQWNSPFWVNFKEEVTRLIKGIYMKL